MSAPAMMVCSHVTVMLCGTRRVDVRLANNAYVFSVLYREDRDPGGKLARARALAIVQAYSDTPPYPQGDSVEALATSAAAQVAGWTP
jgi:hypothetical protein